MPDGNRRKKANSICTSHEKNASVSERKCKQILQKMRIRVMKICTCPKFRGSLGCRSQTTCALDLSSENNHEPHPKWIFFSPQIGIGLALQASNSNRPFCFQKSRIWSRKFLESPRTSRNWNRASSFANRASKDCQLYLCMQCKVYFLGATKHSTPKKPRFRASFCWNLWASS